MSAPPPLRRAVGILGPALLVGAALRATLMLQLAAAPLFRAPLLDAAVYDQWARAIAAGSGSGSQVFFLAPLYPYLLGLVYAVGGDGPLIAVALQHLAGLALIATCGVWVWRCAGALAGGATAWLLALHGPLLVYENLLLAEILGACLLTPAILLLATGRPGWRRAALAGALLGLDALVRPTALVIGGALALWLGWRATSPRGRAVVALCLGMLVAVLPVTLRNRVVAGEWVWITASGGYNLYVGNHAGADGTFVPPPGVRFVPGDAGDPSGRQAAEAASGRSLTAGEVSDHWLQASLAAVRADPGRSLRLYGRKLALVWNRFEVPQIVDLRAVRQEVPLLRLIWPVTAAMLPLALFGLVFAYRGSRRRTPLLVALLVFTAVTALFFITARYRIQIVPLLAVMAGGGVARLVDSLRGDRRRAWRPVVVLLVCVVVTAPALLGLQGAGRPWLPPMNRALRLAATRADSSAVLAAFATAVAAAPDEGLIRVNMGAYRLEIGDIAGAQRAYAEAVRLDPGDPVAWTGLGRTRLRAGEVGPALAALESARELDPTYAPAALAMAQTLDRAGRFAAAEGVAREALAGADSAGAHAVLGMIMRHGGAPTSGLLHLERAAALAPERAGNHFNLGLALIEEERFDGAREALATAVRLEPDYRQAELALSVLLAEMGEFTAARQHLLHLLRATPTDQRLETLLREVEQRLQAGSR